MTVQQYLDDGCEIVNALIVKADISTNDIPSVDVQLKLPMGGVVFGGICFGQSIRGSERMPHGWDQGMTAIFRIMQVAEEVLSTKLFWLLEISPNGALKSMRKYDYRTYGKMLERPIKARKYFQNEPYYGFEATEEELAEAAERVAKKQAILANRVIVELEERIK